MAEDSKVEIEEIIEDLDFSTPSGSRSSSLDRGSYLQSSFQDPTSIPDRLHRMEDSAAATTVGTRQQRHRGRRKRQCDASCSS